MTRPPSEHSSHFSWTRWLIVSLVVIAVAHGADPLAWRALRMPDVYDKDWGRLLRSLGYLPTWGAVALAYWLQLRDRPPGGRVAAYLALSPTVGGIVAEVGKILSRRLRPDDTTFGYAFRPYSDHFWSNKGMGLPSSHTLVAFAGAAALARIFPRARWVFYGLAAGCGLTRVMANAHFLSDTVVAACLGVAVGELLASRLRVPDPGAGGLDPS
ncbi:MAG: phosphatase PAP2 family protein [Gemmatimonadaceae bacterium]|nr:phosphatase PAP2 family protein [Gemmatimonadaceae bacterium]